MVQQEQRDDIQLQHQPKYSGLAATFQSPFQPHLAELSRSNQAYWLPGHKLVTLRCQDSDVDERGAGHEYGEKRSCKPKIIICFPKLKVGLNSTPRFLADADGFASMLMRGIGKQDKYFFRCRSCPIHVAKQKHQIQVPVHGTAPPEPAYVCVSIYIYD